MGDILHSLANANFTAYTYTQVFTTASTQIVLNGTPITLAPPMIIPIKVKTLTSSSPQNVFLIGKFMPYNGTAPQNIKTGLITE